MVLDEVRARRLHPRLHLSSLGLALGLALTLPCCASSGAPPTANPGATYEVTGDNPNYDSGCAQGSPTGKLVRKQRFKLVSVKDGCWLIEFDDQTETYIRPERVKLAE